MKRPIKTISTKYKQKGFLVWVPRHLVRLVHTGDYSPRGPRQLLPGVVVDDMELTAGDRREHRGWQQHLSGHQEHLSGTTGGHDEGERATNKVVAKTPADWSGPSRYRHGLISDYFPNEVTQRWLSLWPADEGSCICSVINVTNWLWVATLLSVFGEKYRLSPKVSPKRTKWKA